MENTAFSVRLLQGVREGKVWVPRHRSGEPFHPLSMVLLERGRGGGGVSELLLGPPVPPGQEVEALTPSIYLRRELRWRSYQLVFSLF